MKTRPDGGRRRNLSITPQRCLLRAQDQHTFWTLYQERVAWTQGFPGGSVVKNPPAMQETQVQGFYPWVLKIPWRRAWQPTPAFSPGEAHGQRSLVGHSLWGHKESDPTEATQHAHRIDIYALPCVNRELAGGCYVAPGAQLSALWWPRGVGSGAGGRFKREKIMCAHRWVTWLYSRNRHNTVKQLHSNLKVYPMINHNGKEH